MSGLIKNKFVLISIAAVVVVIGGVIVGLSFTDPNGGNNSHNQGGALTGSTDTNETNPTAFGDNYGLMIKVKEKNPVILESGGYVRVRVEAVKWKEGQDHSEYPTGEPIKDLPIEFTTSMGLFQDNNSTKYNTKTSKDGVAIVPLVGGELKGVARVTAKALDGSGLAASLQVYIVDVKLTPVEISINKNERINFEATVEGIDDPDLLYYTWRNYDVIGYMKPLDSIICYQNGAPAYKSPILAWQRENGEAKEGYIQVEAFLINPGHEDISLGTAKSDIHLLEYHLDCPLVGRVIRNEKGIVVKYGCLIPKVDDAVAYGVRGYGFNDTLYYGEEYRSGYKRISDLVEEPGGYFLSFTSFSKNSDDSRSDSELIAEIAWRFEGGTFYASPTFGKFE